MQVESVEIHIQLYDLYSQPACPDSAIPPQEPLNAPLFPAQVCPTLKGSTFTPLFSQSGLSGKLMCAMPTAG